MRAFHRERKPFLSRAQRFVLVSAKVYARDEKGRQPMIGARKSDIRRLKTKHWATKTHLPLTGVRAKDAREG